jgi:hypothetical protein
MAVTPRTERVFRYGCITVIAFLAFLVWIFSVAMKMDYGYLELPNGYSLCRSNAGQVGINHEELGLIVDGYINKINF